MKKGRRGDDMKGEERTEKGREKEKRRDESGNGEMIKK